MAHTYEEAKDYCKLKCLSLRYEDKALSNVYGKMYALLAGDGEDDERTLEAGIERMKIYANQPGTITGVRNIVLAHIPYFTFCTPDDRS